MMNLDQIGAGNLIYVVFVLGGGIILFKYLRIIRRLKKIELLKKSTIVYRAFLDVKITV